MSDVRLIVRRFLKQLGAYLWSNTVLPIIGLLFLIIILLGIAYLGAPYLADTPAFVGVKGFAKVWGHTEEIVLFSSNKALRKQFRSLDHPIRPCQHIWWNHEADLLGRFQVDDQLKLYRLLDGKVGRFCALQNFVDVSSGPAEQLWEARAVRHKPTGFDVLREAIHCWKLVFDRKWRD